MALGVVLAQLGSPGILCVVFYINKIAALTVPWCLIVPAQGFKSTYSWVDGLLYWWSDLQFNRVVNFNILK